MGLRPGRIVEEVGEANLAASPFRIRVYRVVHRVPPGRVVTYAQVAEAVGASGAARAVGTALRENRDTRRVPCHRVVRADGGVGLYQGGLAGQGAKIERLAEEGVEVDARGRILGFSEVRLSRLPPLAAQGGPPPGPAPGDPRALGVSGP